MCDAKKLRGFGFTKTFANRIEALRNCLFVEEDLIEHSGMSQDVFANMWRAHNINHHDLSSQAKVVLG